MSTLHDLHRPDSTGDEVEDSHLLGSYFFEPPIGDEEEVNSIHADDEDPVADQGICAARSYPLPDSLVADAKPPQLPLTTSLAASPIQSAPRACDRAPLTPLAVPQPRVGTPQQTPKALFEMAMKAAQKGYDATDYGSVGLPEELSTAPPSSAGGRISPRRLACHSPSRSVCGSVTGTQRCGSHSPSPRRQPTSPRTKMNDVLHGPRSLIRYPECHKSPIPSAAACGLRYTTPMMSPRNLAGDNFPRAGLAASNDCVRQLRSCQTYTHTEDVVEELLSDQQDPRYVADYAFARERLRVPSYRDAARCATTMRARTKPTTAWR